MKLEQAINDMVKTRGEKRRIATSRVSNTFFNFLRNGNYTQFSKSLFSSFISDEINARTSQRLTKEVFKILIDSGKITPIKTTKNFVSLENKPLSCWDSGSYSAMMSKNGYRMAYYIYEYDTEKKCPKKVKVGSSPMGASVSFYYDTAEPVSIKPRQNQAVTTNSRLSVVKRTHKRAVKMFKVN